MFPCGKNAEIGVLIVVVVPINVINMTALKQLPNKRLSYKSMH